jgi:hypothetical protein
MVSYGIRTREAGCRKSDMDYFGPGRREGERREDARGERGFDNVQLLEITFVVMQEVVSCAITYMIHRMMCWK